jgi:predicted RNase H-like HicB family nuclease
MKVIENELQVSVIIEKSDDGFWVSVEDLPGCYSFGKTILEALENTRNAMNEHITGLKESGGKVPDLFSGDYEFKLKFDLQTLFAYYRIINKTALAKYTGINASLLRQYAKGLAFASEKQREKIEIALHRIGKEFTLVSL